MAGGGSAQAAGRVGPDVTVFSFTDISSYGSSGGFAGYSLGTTLLQPRRLAAQLVRPEQRLRPRRRTEGPPGHRPEPLPVEERPLRADRHELAEARVRVAQRGDAGCSGAAGQSCQPPPAGGNQLGVGCTDPYVASLNGGRPLGRRSEVNATTGVFPYPYSSPGGPYAVYDQRIKVAATDVNPAQNAGAPYWVEGHYIASDDAGSGNALNNASHRQVTVGAAPNFGLSMTGTFFEQKPAIFAWPAQDPAVALVNVDVPGALVERFHVARKVTDLGGGLWHYEYAVHNLNSDRSARSFTVEFPVATAFTNVGFKGIAHHSGEPYATGDWLPSTRAASSPGPPTPSPPIRTPTPCASPRCSTSGSTPISRRRSDIVHTLGLFKPGDPSSSSSRSSTDLFGDGFESGSIGAWSSASP